jgi:hypothetical protein
MPYRITQDDIADEVNTRLADASHLYTEVIARHDGPERVPLYDLRQEYRSRHQYLLAFLVDCAIRIHQRQDEDTIPEAPEDSDIGRTMKRLLLTEHPGDALKKAFDTRGDERDEATPDPEWRVEWSCDITAPTAWGAALIAQQMMQDPENTAGCFDVLPWRDGEVQREEGMAVDLTSNVPPAMPDDSQWVPGL